MRRDLPYPDALAAVLASATDLSSERVALDRALGRHLAESITSPLAVPPFAASAMDGFAVRRADLPHVPIELPVAGASWAGAPFVGPIPTGAAVQIATGAVVPEEADAVVPVEWTNHRGAQVVIQRDPPAGHAIRPAGSALLSGTELLPAGATITPGAISVLASCGIHEVPCVRRPRVQILVTGDEVVPVGTPLARGQIYDANGPALAALVNTSGGLAELVRVGDDPGAIAGAVSHDADLVLVTGGVSVGERDRVRDELGGIGAEWVFWRVRQRPGKPLLFGHLGEMPILGLPGNPVSALVGFEVYARPLLGRMMRVELLAITEPARLLQPLPKVAGLHTFARVHASRGADGVLEVTSAAAQDSHVGRSLLGDGLAHLPAMWSEARPGAEVDFQPFSWSPPPCSFEPSA